MNTIATVVGLSSNPRLPYAFFTPSQVANCLAWYTLLNAISFTATGAVLNTLPDCSGNGRDMTGSPAGNTMVVVAGPVAGTSGVESQPLGTASSIRGAYGGSLVRDRSQPFSMSMILTTPSAWPGLDHPTVAGVGGFDNAANGAGFAIRMTRSSSSPYQFSLYIDFTSATNQNHLIRVQTPLLTYGKTYHVVVTYSGSGTAAGVTAYFNGAAVSLTTVSDTLGGDSIVCATSAPFIGTDNAYQTNLCPVNDLAYYSAVVSPSDIAALYGYANTRFAAGN